MAKDIIKLLIEIKEDIFYIMFQYGYFDLNLMKSINTLFNLILRKFINF